jgi:hypothetical protein
MKTFGIAVIVLGIVCELLLTLARLGGGAVSPTAFGVSAMLIATGWRLRKEGA